MKNNNAWFISFSFDHREALDIEAHYPVLRLTGRSGGALEVVLDNAS